MTNWATAGITTSDIEAHIEDIYGVEVSDTTISHIADKILPVSKEWQQRPLESVYLSFSAETLLCHSENHFLNASLRNTVQKIQTSFIKILAKFFTYCYTIFHKAHLFSLCGW